MTLIFGKYFMNRVKSGGEKFLWFVHILLLVGLLGCGPNDKERAAIEEQKRIVCLDTPCAGDVTPKHDLQNETAFKVNGQWFIGPTEYFSNVGIASFSWWEHKSYSSLMSLPTELKVHMVDGKNDFSIAIFFRSNHIPPQPRGYKLIELAEKNDWILSRKTIRRGLDAITMKHVVGQNGHYFDHVTYYVGTDLIGLDGLPPVGVCSHDHPMNGGGTGFIWRPGIWVGVRMNQTHCVDWPEIYQEITRVLSLLREV